MDALGRHLDQADKYLDDMDELGEYHKAVDTPSGIASAFQMSLLEGTSENHPQYYSMKALIWRGMLALGVKS